MSSHETDARSSPSPALEVPPVARLVNVMISPGETFEAIRARPTWVLALLVLLILGAVSSFIALERVDEDAQRAEIVRQLEEGQGLSRQEAEEGAERGMEFNRKLQPFFPAIGAVMGILAYLVIAGLFFGGHRFLGGGASFGQIWSTTLHGMMPQALKALILTPILLLGGPLDPRALQSGTYFASNPAFFLPEDASPVLVSALSSLDLFTLWSLILLVIGVSVVGRISRGASAGVVVGLWLVYVIGKVALVAVFMG